MESPDEFAAALEADGFDLILSDHALPSYDGLSVLARARKRCPEVPFIFVYRYGSGEQALDFIAKIAESSTEYSVVGKVNVHPAHGTLETALENAGQRAMGEPLHVVHLLTLSGRLCGGAVVALGTAVLAGWAWDIAALKASCPNSRR